MPLGRVSLKLIDPTPFACEVLSIKYVRRVVSPALIVLGEKLFEKLAVLSATVKPVEEDVVMPMSDDRLNAGIVYELATDDVTLACTVHEVDPGNCPPLNEIVLPPAAPLRVALVQSV